MRPLPTAEYPDKKEGVTLKCTRTQEMVRSSNSIFIAHCLSPTYKGMLQRLARPQTDVQQLRGHREAGPDAPHIRRHRRLHVSASSEFNDRWTLIYLLTLRCDATRQSGRSERRHREQPSWGRAEPRFVCEGAGGGASCMFSPSICRVL